MLVTASPSFSAKESLVSSPYSLLSDRSQAVILPVCQTHRAVDLEQGGSLALLHLAHQGGLVLAGSSGDNGHRHAGLLGVLSGQILPILILLGLEVQVVDLAGSLRRAVLEAAVELAVEAAVLLEEPPQAARPRAAAEAPATFRKLRREIIFFIIVLLLHHVIMITFRPERRK